MYIVFAAHLRGVVMKGKAAPCMKNALAGVGGDDGVYAVVFAASAAIFIYGDSRSSSTAPAVLHLRRQPFFMLAAGKLFIINEARLRRMKTRLSARNEELPCGE